MKLNKTVTQWIRYARTDLKVAKFSLEASADFKSAAAFHSQQCAEKIIKAYLTHFKVRVQKTHDIELLLTEVSKISSALAKRALKAKLLTTYAVTYRYPDAERKPLTVAKARAAIKIAEATFEEFLDAIHEK